MPFSGRFALASQVASKGLDCKYEIGNKGSGLFVQKRIAVGTAIAGRSPHRSVREEFSHTALAANRSRNRTLG